MNKINRFQIIKIIFFIFILSIPNYNNAKELLIYADSITYDEKKNIIARGNAKIFHKNNTFHKYMNKILHELQIQYHFHLLILI